MWAVKLRKPSPPHWDRRIAHARCLGDSLPPSPPAEKATAHQDQAGQGRIDDEELMAGVQIPKIPPFTTCNFMRTCELGA